MYPTIESDDISLFDISTKNIVAGKVYMFTINGEILVKRLQKFNDEKDSLFFVGDNKSASIDSRHFGMIPVDDVIGQYLFSINN